MADWVEKRLSSSGHLAIILSSIACLCCALGAIVSMLIFAPRSSHYHLCLSQCALGGLLLFWGCSDILPEAAIGISKVKALFAFLTGALITSLCAYFFRKKNYLVTQDLHGITVPNTRTDSTPIESSSISSSTEILSQYTNVADTTNPSSQNQILDPSLTHISRFQEDQEILASGLITCFCIAVHNLLEGSAISFATYEGVHVGVPLALAIGLENIPEGALIALPIYFATGSKSKALFCALAAGLCELFGVVIVVCVIKTSLSQELVSSSLAVVAGILVGLCSGVLLPMALKNTEVSSLKALSKAVGIGLLCALIMQPMLMYHGRVGFVQ